MHNILVVTYWSFKDALIQGYTLPYLKIILKYLPAGSKIHLVPLEQDKLKVNEEEANQINTLLEKENIVWHPYQYQPFGLGAIIKWLGYIFDLTHIIKENRIKTIHTWCTPAGGIGYILSKLTGLPLVLDSYEPHAALMKDTHTWEPNSVAFRILFWLEQKQTARAKHIIGCVASAKQYAKTNYNFNIRKENFHVKPACVDFNNFDITKSKNKQLLQEFNLENKIVCLYAGKFGDSYLYNETFEFFASASKYWGDDIRFLLLSDLPDSNLQEMCSIYNIDINKFVKLFVSYNEIANYIGLGDFALSPYVPVPAKRYGTPIKNGEYWAMGLPVVITPNISDDSDIIEQEQIGAVIRSFDDEGYLYAIKVIDHILKNTDNTSLKKKIKGIAEKYRSFEIAEKVYQKIYAK